MECHICRKRGVVYQAHFRRVLCRDCFIEDLRERVKREVERWKLLEHGDTVLLAVSGGKDSFVLLDVLPRLFKSSRFVALTIVEGIPNYNRLSDVESLFELTRELGVDLIVVSFKEYIGYSLAELVDKASSLELPHSPCTYCGVVRRHAMNKIAEELGARKVATAHVLDDEIQTFLMNFLHGDWKGVLKLHPLTSRKLSGPVRIKPLRKVYEWEVATYAYLRGYRFQETECPYITYRPTLRARLRAKLLTVERELPGTLLKMMEFLDELLSVETDNMRESFKECPLCGALTSFERETCRLCELLRELNLGHAPRTLGALFRSSLRA